MTNLVPSQQRHTSNTIIAYPLLLFNNRLIHTLQCQALMLDRLIRNFSSLEIRNVARGSRKNDMKRRSRVVCYFKAQGFDWLETCSRVKLEIFWGYSREN
jgi:hypothetical protein